MDTKTYARPTIQDDAPPVPTEVSSERAKRAVLILCAVLATISPAALALVIGVSVADTARVLALTLAAVASAFLLLRPR